MGKALGSLILVSSSICPVPQVRNTLGFQSPICGVSRIYMRLSVSYLNIYYTLGVVNL